MGSYKVQNLTFTYPGRNSPALNNLSFTIEDGQFIALIGPSGCGKTTLLRMLKPAFAAHGSLSGSVLFEGMPAADLDARTESAKIGFVMQNPDNQIVTDKVWHELAFGLESLGYDTQIIRMRVAEMASFFGIQAWFHKNVAELSGGQKQLLNLASIMAMQPSVLILDEPTSQLDPIAASEFLATIGKINRELGVTVIMTEHRLEEVFPLSDRIIVMDGGRFVADGTPSEIGITLKGKKHGMFHAIPVPMRVFAAVDSNLACPVTVRDGRDWLNQMVKDRGRLSIDGIDYHDALKRVNPAVELDEVWFRYGKEQPDVIKGLSFKAYPGEITAMLGGNGTGKTTALSLVCGINRPYSGKALIEGAAHEKINDLFNGVLGVLPQNPQVLFVCKTVEEDLLEMFSGIKIDEAEKSERLRKAISLCRLCGLLQSHPYDLSGGEQQRAALAKILLLKPRILLLDEPTKGIDAEFKLAFAEILRELTGDGVTVVIVSHDVEFCAEHADRCAMFFDGNIVSINDPRTFFSGNSFYTSSANRMARHVLSDAITARDIVTALEGDASVLTPGNVIDEAAAENALRSVKDEEIMPALKPEQMNAGKGYISKHTIAVAAMILLVIPATIWIGINFLDNRRYNLISTIIILATMLPFALVFESRKPRAMELIVIAVLCAVGVAGRTAFFMLPQFKPVIAIVIIAGAAFGGGAGFFVGAITGFVSNMFLGQGPWTPWQMFSFGIIGFLAGALFHEGILRRSRAALCAYGGIAALLIYGPIINLSYIFIFQLNPTREMIYLVLLHGLPLDLVHAAATITFLFIISRPMFEKLDRVKLKYGTN